MTSLAERRVLVVEDDYYQADDIAGALGRAGAAVVGPFRNETAALPALDRDGVDCAVLDINFGCGVSFELADRMRDHGMPFLFLTGYERAIIPERFRDVKRLTKPLDERRLVEGVRFLQMRAARDG